jgi:hypothetical protein
VEMTERGKANCAFPSLLGKRTTRASHIPTASTTTAAASQLRSTQNQNPKTGSPKL